MFRFFLLFILAMLDLSMKCTLWHRSLLFTIIVIGYFDNRIITRSHASVRVLKVKVKVAILDIALLT